MKKKIITFRVTKKIAQLLEKRKKKQTRSAFIRTAIQAYFSDVDLVSIEKCLSETKDLKTKLAPVGSNLNQLAYAYNSQGTLRFTETVKFLNELQVLLTDVQQQNKKIIRAVENYL